MLYPGYVLDDVLGACASTLATARASVCRAGGCQPQQASSQFVRDGVHALPGNHIEMHNQTRIKSEHYLDYSLYVCRERNLGSVTLTKPKTVRDLRVCQSPTDTLE